MSIERQTGNGANNGAIQPDVVEIVEQAATFSDLPTTQRAVLRSRWGLDEESVKEPVVEKPKYNYARVPY